MAKNLRTWGYLRLIIMAIAFHVAPAIAQPRDLGKFVDSIRSVDQVKKDIRELIITVDGCAVGSCYNFNSTAICELVGALDVQVNGQIIGGVLGGSAKIPISRSDLTLMKDIFSQCKPTNYQY